MKIKILVVLLAAQMLITCSCGAGADLNPSPSPNISQRNPYPSEVEAFGNAIDHPAEEANEEDISVSPEEIISNAAHTLSVWSGGIAESFGGGNGSSENPYQISTAEQLAKLSQDTKSGVDFSGKYFVLTSDILLNDISSWNYGNMLNTEKSSIFQNANQWIPIGVQNPIEPFRGHFDGCDHIIFGLYNTTSNGGGLFGNVSDTSIENLTVMCSVIAPTDGTSCCIAGNAINTKLINCHASECILGHDNDFFVDIGGICGYVGDSGSAIRNCSAIVDIIFDEISGDSPSLNSGLYIGGIVSRIYDDDIEVSNCYSDVSIQARYSRMLNVFAGGIGGTVYNISNCYSVVNFNIEPTYIPERARVGGIAGVSASVNNTASRGHINVKFGGINDAVGGISGQLGQAKIMRKINCQYCYSDVSISGVYHSKAYSGIAGTILGDVEIQNCYYSSNYYQKSYAGQMEDSVIFTNQISSYSSDELKDPNNYSDWNHDTIWVAKNGVNDGYPIQSSLLEYYTPSSDDGGTKRKNQTLSSSEQPESHVNESLDLSQYLHQNIYDVIPLLDNMQDNAATDGSVAYSNDAIIICSGLGIDDVEFINIFGDCDYTLLGIEYGMHLSEAQSIAESIGELIPGGRPDIMEYQLNTGNQLSIVSENGFTVSDVSLFAY